MCGASIFQVGPNKILVKEGIEVQPERNLSPQVSGQQFWEALFDVLPALPHEQGFFPIPLPRAVAKQMMAAPGQFPFPVAGISPQPATQPAQAPSLPPPPQPRAVAPPPPPAPVTSIRRPVAERRGM